MTKETRNAYNAVATLASDLSIKLSRSEYREFLEELAAHFECQVRALDEEEAA